MPLGDSITVGAYSSTGGGYRLPLWRELEARGARIDFVGSQSDGISEDPDHEGHSGYTIDQIGEGIDGWLAQAQPDIILLHLGINDLDRGHSAGASLRLVALVDRIHADRPGAGVIVQGLIPTTAGLEEGAQSFNADVRQVAGGHDFAWVEPPALTAGEMTDRLHPNDEGYKRLATAYELALQGSPRPIGRCS
jgi:lysophospholipase L1-like esterase